MTKKELFYHIINTEAIYPVYQPIISLKDGSVIAYEALTRFERQINADNYGVMLNVEEFFQIAASENILWEVERLCRNKSLANSFARPRNTGLFLNVDGNIIRNPDFGLDLTSERLKQYQLSPDDIIFEITELNSVPDDKAAQLIATIRHYHEKRFHIAIDDYGCGYSGLNRVCSFQPDYLKIDIELIHNIDKVAMKRSAVNSTLSFCKENGIKVIAEGIETEAELKTLISLGVEYGQGYYLARPSEQFYRSEKWLVGQIHSFYNNQAIASATSVLGQIHCIGTRTQTVSTDTPSEYIYQQMTADETLTEVFVLDDRNHICGILTRDHILERYGGQYGYNLSRRLSAAQIMEVDYLSVDAQTPIEKASKLAMERSVRHIYDAIAITRENEYVSSVSVKKLLLSAIEIQVKYAADANPLTGLPGNSRIQEMIRTTFVKQTPWSIIYLDLDNFKAYNDAYGFGNGDKMLVTLSKTIQSCCMGSDFCGHIGGDDFVIITDHYDTDLLCDHICKQFHDSISHLYSVSDWHRGSIISKNRKGAVESFPIASLSIAVVSNQYKQPTNLEELSEIITSTKKLCKQRNGDSIIAV